MIAVAFAAAWLAGKTDRAAAALNSRLARVRRFWLRTARLEGMPAHPESLAGRDPEWQHTVDRLVAHETRWVAAMKTAAHRSGWSRDDH